MSQFIYDGEDERVFPTLSITVKKDEAFEAPSDFSAFNVSSTSNSIKKAAPAADLAPSAPSDSTAEEVK